MWNFSNRPAVLLREYSDDCKQENNLEDVNTEGQARISKTSKCSSRFHIAFFACSEVEGLRKYPGQIWSQENENQD
jgi:hypothetical protein